MIFQSTKEAPLLWRCTQFIVCSSGVSSSTYHHTGNNGGRSFSCKPNHVFLLCRTPWPPPPAFCICLHL
ncbi:hypothetical protein L1887_27212 [Cichorium endivia]|nr:hypothetical protein L1887_27212 [Cichorium endivia]